MLAGLSGASIQERVALGPREGSRSMALGQDPEARWVSSGGPRHAYLDGFEVCCEARARGLAVPVLMLSARAQVVDWWTAWWVRVSSSVPTTIW